MTRHGIMLVKCVERFCNSTYQIAMLPLASRNLTAYSAYMMTNNSDDTTKPEQSADEKARRRREIGDANAVYGEVGQNDEQRDTNQPEQDEHV
jgi:hypothetical protein